jgi:hypothetical protein
MSDELDANTRRTLHTLMQCYDALADVAAKLPTLPITLPMTMKDGYWADRSEAVAHASAICYEIPMPMKARDAFKCACLYWLGASDLLVMQAMDARQYRNEAARFQILSAEDYIRDTRRILGVQE